MALRNIIKDGEKGSETLRKKAKRVDLIDKKILALLKDMAETMYSVDGVGLAAPQVGILKRVVVIDVGEGLLELINPEIVQESGEQVGVEGCLSVPRLIGEVKRPQKVIVEALNPQGEKIRVEGEGILARALCHEVDHLEGILFTDKAIRLMDSEEQNEKD